MVRSHLDDSDQITLNRVEFGHKGLGWTLLNLRMSAIEYNQDIFFKPIHNSIEPLVYHYKIFNIMLFNFYDLG